MAFVVETKGIGRRDYSENIEVATEPFIRSRQLRFFYSIRYTALAALTYPNVYEAPLVFLVNGQLQDAAPSTPYLFSFLTAAANRNALVALQFNRYESYQDYLNGNIAEVLGCSYGYEKTDLRFTKPIPTREGSVYSVYIAEFSNLAFNLELAIHGLIGALETLE
jgi:hypothetical protein